MTKDFDIHHLEKMTVKELREIAVKYPHERAVSEMKKEELIAFIREVMGIKEEDTHKKKAKVKVKMTKPEVKAKIRELKQRRYEIHQKGGDKKEARYLRRRISRLKKLSRRISSL
ncbi:MAG: Rho termination factor N-terminal domain-containing protein [Syntrophales bacterium]|nr:Rho termination factor N-terminal domain-containing protein [Syntrophales bacterium]